MNIGTDTGFFVELLRGNSIATEVWENLIHGEDQGFCSALTLFEIERLGLKGSITKEAASSLLEAIPAVCRMTWIEDRKIAADAARLSHGLGLPAVDALILAGFVQAGVEMIYTTDKHMEVYKAKGVLTVNLSSVTKTGNG